MAETSAEYGGRRLETTDGGEKILCLKMVSIYYWSG